MKTPSLEMQALFSFSFALSLSFVLSLYMGEK